MDYNPVESSNIINFNHKYYTYDHLHHLQLLMEVVPEIQYIEWSKVSFESISKNCKWLKGTKQ